MFGVGELSSKFRSIFDTQETLTVFHGNEAKKYIFLKIFKMADSKKKLRFSKPTNLKKKFTKISGIGPRVSRID